MLSTRILHFIADEDTVLEEAMDNLKEAEQRIRATQSLLRSEGMTDGENHRDLLTHLSTALAMTEAASRAGRLSTNRWPAYLPCLSLLRSSSSACLRSLASPSQQAIQTW